MVSRRAEVPNHTLCIPYIPPEWTSDHTVSLTFQQKIIFSHHCQNLSLNRIKCTIKAVAVLFYEILTLWWWWWCSSTVMGVRVVVVVVLVVVGGTMNVMNRKYHSQQYQPGQLNVISHFSNHTNIIFPTKLYTKSRIWYQGSGKLY